MQPMQGQQPPMPPQGQPSNGGGQVSQLVQRVHTDLLKLQEVLSGSSVVPPPAVQKIQALVQQYEALVQEITAGGQPKPQQPPMPQPQPSGPVPLHQKSIPVGR